jgi:hypothetical protein
MSKRIVAAVVAELQRRGAEPFDDEAPEGVLVLDDLQMKVDPPADAWIGARLVFRLASGLPDGRREQELPARRGGSPDGTQRMKP